MSEDETRTNASTRREHREKGGRKVNERSASYRIPSVSTTPKEGKEKKSVPSQLLYLLQSIIGTRLTFSNLATSALSNPANAIASSPFSFFPPATNPVAPPTPPAAVGAPA